MIRRIKEAWFHWKDVFRKMLAQICPDPGKVHFWPFFSGSKASDEPQGDYPLADDEVLVCPGSRIIKLPLWTDSLPKRPLNKAALAALERRREHFRVHSEDHLKSVPHPSPMRDCPVCKFGVHEWRFWEDPIKFLAYEVWEEFWDWISEKAELLTKSHREILEQFPALPYDVLCQFDDPDFINRLVRLGPKGMVRYLRHQQSREVARRQRHENRLAEQLAHPAAMGFLNSTQDVLI
jgi:hypothetical protein